MSDLHERLSSWRHVAGVVEPSSKGETREVEEHVRSRQRRIGTLCLATVKMHDAFYAELKAYVEKGDRDPQHQQRVNDYAAFALRVYEQNSGLVLQRGIHYVIEDLPREVVRIHKEYVEPPRRSWIQRLVSG